MPNKMRVTVVSNNIVTDGFKKEHGLSILIESDGRYILFDTGAGDVFIQNFEKLFVSYENIDFLILSHGHYDHGGNIDMVLENNKKALFYAHRDCTLKRYSLHDNKPVKDISLGANTVEAIRNLPSDRLVWCDGITELYNRCFVTGEIPRINDFENTGGPFYLDTKGNISDSIKDDQSIWFETENGILIFTGCCHSGIVNTIDYVLKNSSQDKIRAIIGGFHLINSSAYRINKTVDFLKKISPEIIIPLHCTGDSATEILYQEFGDSVLKLLGGEEVVL